MTKNELAERVSARTGLATSQARQVVEASIEVISDELAAGGRSRLPASASSASATGLLAWGATPRRARPSRSRPPRRPNSQRRAP